MSSDGPPSAWGEQDVWVLPDSTGMAPADFVDAVDNPYFPLVPGATWVYEAETDEGLETIEIEVLDETRDVMGVECTVVRDTVTVDGELFEDTRDWYAQDREGNVWYMGEDVDNYKGGVVVNHAGAWEAGVDGALPGVKMWAEPRIGGAAYYQEYYEGEATDLGKDLQTDAEVTVAFGGFADVLVVEEWNPLEPGVVERKYYAEGVGVVLEEVTSGGSERVELIEHAAP